MDLLTWIILASFIFTTMLGLSAIYFAKKHSQEG